MIVLYIIFRVGFFLLYLIVNFEIYNIFIIVGLWKKKKNEEWLYFFLWLFVDW